MARLEEREYTYFTTVRGMCRECRRVAPARVFFRNGKVWQEGLCPNCEGEPGLVAGDVQWYLQNCLGPFPDRSPLEGSHAPERGCPNDCGPCSWHASPCQLPVIPITDADDPERLPGPEMGRAAAVSHMPVETVQGMLDSLIGSSGPFDIVNITGGVGSDPPGEVARHRGEPTLHPQLLDIVESCRRPEVGRVAVHSNGLGLAEDPALCARLSESGAYVTLSVDALDPGTSVRLYGRDVVRSKLDAIHNLAHAGVRMTLVCRLLRGINEDVVAGALDLMRGNDAIVGLTIETGSRTLDTLEDATRPSMPVDEAARLVCRAAREELELADFLPRPSAHPLCYLTCIMLKVGERFVPFTRFATRERISAAMADSYLIRLESEHDFFRDATGAGSAEGDAERMGLFRALIEDTYPPGGAPGVFARQRAAERAVRAVYVHAPMKADTFDCARAMLCTDMVLSRPGRMVPQCVHDLMHGKDRQSDVRQ